MTNGKYTQAVMDENLSMMVYDGFDHIDMKYLSNATVEQLYFALRLASADLLYENDAFPLFLDDVFGNYDDERLAQTMQYLSHHTDRQIFLFTGRKEILRLLDEKEIYIILFLYSFFCAKIMRDKVTKEIKIYGKEDDHGRYRKFIRSWKKHSIPLF